MRINFKFTVILALFSITAVSCQKETIVKPNTQVQQSLSTRNITYSIDGITTNTNIEGEQNWHDFIEWLLGLAEKGHRVSFRSYDYEAGVSSSKDVQQYKTNDKAKANAWANDMLDRGYEVTIEFDSSTGTYICTAVK